MVKGLVKVSAVANRLGVAPHRVYQLVSEGAIPVVRLGERSLRFDMDKIEAWIANGGGTPQSQASEQQQAA